MSGWTTSLLTGLAEYLAAAGVGTWHGDPGQPYAATDTAIVLGGMPQQPDRVILLTAYPLDEDVAQADVTVGVQVRTRAGPDPRDVADLDDAVFDVLHGATRLTLGGVNVVQAYRRSSASLGQARDATGRWERTSNFYLDAMRPSVWRPY